MGTRRAFLRLSGLFALLVFICVSVLRVHAPAKADLAWWSGRVGDFTAAFGGGATLPSHPEPHIDDALHAASEAFNIHVPPGYAADGTWGLVVYIDPYDDPFGPPAGWAAVLDRHKLLFVEPLRAGNGQDLSRRLGLGVVAAEAMSRRYRVDSRRLFAAGFSGGARMAGRLGFYRPDLFHGTVQSCGADFDKPVPRVFATQAIADQYGSYGDLDATAAEARQARRVRFALITGPGDLRHGNILDLYNGGFAAEGYTAKLFDVAGMAHSPASAATLDAALDFVDRS